MYLKLIRLLSKGKGHIREVNSKPNKCEDKRKF